ncbi:hypothetical protein B0H67DRAFT_193771 [Lasiosphaeris hirsuta]|uniref:Uncharacterized protein n=1 Tax=Lasiosphaeris hirsuta TaxID=260670 RepID=A0AA40ARC5_9PEZI|nr:hypothetical protein B0H67DRAFT_193771 [Lasiosphaeris hirsuta]
MDLTILYILLFLIPIAFCCFAVISDILDVRRKKKDAKLDEEMGRFAKWWDPDFMKRFKEGRLASRQRAEEVAARYGVKPPQPSLPSPKPYPTSNVDAVAKLRTLLEPKPADDPTSLTASSSYPPVRPPGWTYGNLINPPKEIDLADAKDRNEPPSAFMAQYDGPIDGPSTTIPGREREHYPQEVEDAFEVYRARVLNGESVAPLLVPTPEELQREIDAQTRVGLGPGIREYYGGRPEHDQAMQGDARQDKGKGKEKERGRGENRDENHPQSRSLDGDGKDRDREGRGRHRDRDPDKKKHRSHSEHRHRQSRRDDRDDKHRQRRHRSRDPNREQRHQEKEALRRESEKLDKELQEYRDAHELQQDHKGRMRYVYVGNDPRFITKDKSNHWHLRKF